MKMQILAGLLCTSRSRGFLSDLLEDVITTDENVVIKYFSQLYKKKIELKLKARRRIDNRKRFRGVYMKSIRKTSKSPGKKERRVKNHVCKTKK